MQSKKCDYCGVIQNLSTDKCTNCGGLLNQLNTRNLNLTDKKKFIFALLFILLLISPLAYHQHIENTSDAILKKLQPDRIAPSRVEPDLPPSIYAHYQIKAKFTNALVEVSPIKMLIAEYFFSMGSYPASLNDLGLNESTLDAGELVQTIHLSEKGIILIHLAADDFGNDKTLTLTPSLTMGGMNMHWACSSNLETYLISGMCHSTFLK